MHILPVRPEVEAFTPYSPGEAIEDIQERYGLSRVIKLASNENPLGISPIVEARLQKSSALAFRYAQAGTPRLSCALGAHLGVSPQRIVAGNGSDELIDLLLRVTAQPGKDTVVAFKPSFHIYELQARLCGVEFLQAPLSEDFSFDFSKLLERVDARTAVVFLTNPDNPSGFTCPAAEIADFAAKLPERTLLVVDEAYIEFTTPFETYSMLPYLERFPNLVLLRTFSKMYGLAGLRLGYGIMSPELAELVLRIKLPFSVNVCAEQAGLAVLEDSFYHAATRRMVHEGLAVLDRGLQQLGCVVYPSQANFLMFRPPCSAQMLFQSLLERGIIIRPLASYGHPELLRVSVGNEEENAEFLQKTAEVLA